VTVARVRAFAEAAARFYDARPWQHLANEDLVVVEAPKAPKAMACVSVLGKGGQEFGLAFFESRRAFERAASGSPSVRRRTCHLLTSTSRKTTDSHGTARQNDGS